MTDKKSISYPLTSSDMTRLFPALKLILYPKLNLKTPFPKYGMLLYFDNPSGGHWTGILNRGNNFIEVFDSYGVKPDEEFKWIGSKIRKEQNQHRNILTEKLMNCSRVEFNPYKFQSEDSGIATCGRWVALRACFSNLSIDEFYKMICEWSDKLKITKDELATMITNKYL